MKEDTPRGLAHEPIVSESLKENRRRQLAEAERSAGTTERIESTTDRLRAGEASSDAEDRQDAPLKRHGDALLTGTGNRHGEHDRHERPDVCDRSGTREAPEEGP